MMRVAVFGLAVAALAGCVNWQASYDSAARKDCRAMVDAGARQDCLSSVERNASEKRADART
jgi:hypothetical protein